MITGNELGGLPCLWNDKWGVMTYQSSIPRLRLPDHGRARGYLSLLATSPNDVPCNECCQARAGQK